VHFIDLKTIFLKNQNWVLEFSLLMDTEKQMIPRLKYQDKTIVFADLLAQQDIFRSVCDGL
jgi:hypothetical protein